jgi:aldose 1-epimerase
MKIERSGFGALPDGCRVDLFTLSNNHGFEVAITNFGGIVVSVMAPDRNGDRADVVLGFEKLDSYVADQTYIGAVVGRYANRIAAGAFTLDGLEYQLATNNGPNHLHGGETGFNRTLWNARHETSPAGPLLQLTHVSPEGDEGYPGRLEVAVSYLVTEGNELRIDYHAVTDRPTHVNLTNHSYFNLCGASDTDALAHRLAIAANAFTPVNSDLIPTGELRPVEGTPMDFRQPTVIGARIDDDDEQLRLAGGYDHNWVLGTSGNLDRPAATVIEPVSGRVMEVWTTEPGVQFYTGNFINPSIIGKAGRTYEPRCAFCLETQHFPNSPNLPDFPSTVLRPGEEYQSTTIYRFGVDS